jgi:hypothetical protein
VGLTFLAHRLGVIGTEEQLGYAVIHQFLAILTQEQVFVAEILVQPGISDSEGISVFCLMIFPAKDRDEIG